MAWFLLDGENAYLTRARGATAVWGIGLIGPAARVE
jgi:hypothetical protein